MPSLLDPRNKKRPYLLPLPYKTVFTEDLVSIGVFYDDKLIAFTINELVSRDYCICHFMKGDNSFKGVYSYLVGETSKILLTTGRKYINFEQDLGLPNLRQSKKTFEPVGFLKKYTITPNFFLR